MNLGSVKEHYAIRLVPENHTLLLVSTKKVGKKKNPAFSPHLPPVTCKDLRECKPENGCPYCLSRDTG
jgi:hypothetical protein